MKFFITQFQWGRKWYGGKWYLINAIQLRIAPFWTDQQINSCQAKTIKTEEYKFKRL